MKAILINKVKNYIQHPTILLKIVLNHIAPLIKDDETFIRLKWSLSCMGYPLNMEHPKTFNEKLQWLKLHDRRPEYTIMVDKVKAKQWVAERIGKQYIIPTLGVWEQPEDIDFDQLPNQFVLKCNHNSGDGMFIIKEKSKMDIQQVIKGLRKGIKQNYFWRNREWPYKDVKPLILAEQYMEDEDTKELRDYKFFCFYGVPKALFVATDRNCKTEETKFDFYDIELNNLPFTNGHPNSTKNIVIPENYEEMKAIAAKLSAGFPHVRVDLYSINGKTYFGEMTLSHWSGMMPFVPEDWDHKFGEWLKLPESTIVT